MCSTRCRALGFLVPVLAVSTFIAVSIGGEVPGDLALEPLLVAPRAAPASQLVRLRFSGETPVRPPRVLIELPGRDRMDVVCGPLDETLGGHVVAIPDVERETPITVRATGEGWEREARATLRPLRPWTLYLVQHTHTDIGYTALPSRLSVDHLTFIDEAVRACRLTDSFPDDSRFRWTCEATWAVERYLDARPPDHVRQLLRRIQEGRIEVTAMRMNMTDLASEELVVRNLLPVGRLRARGIPIRTAMQCDVNGYPWILPELLAEIGVEGLAGGINHTRSTLPFEFPRGITWESPGGSGITAWRGEHYMFANMMGFRESVEAVLSRLPGYLGWLQELGYPYDIALLQMAGYFTDNAAPSHRASELVREWNERFAAPRVRLATLSQWFEALAPQAVDPAGAPVMRKAWPDWWADGVGSAPLETSIIRSVQERLAFAETVQALARARGLEVPDRRADYRSVHLLASLYDEHTFGAAESIHRPLSTNTRTQWREKATHAHRARWLTAGLEDAALAVSAPLLAAPGAAAIVVMNSLGWERDGPVLVELPRGVVEEGTPFRIVDAQTRREVPHQLAASTRNYREVEFVARGVPAVGYRVYEVQPGREPASAAGDLSVEGPTLANGLTRVELDPARAGIASIRTLPDGENTVDLDHPFLFNQYIHERIEHEKKRGYLWPAADSYSPEAFSRIAATGGRIEAGAVGPVRSSLRLLTELETPEGTIHLTTEVSLYRGLDGVYIENRVETPGTTDPVAGYFAFPFAAGGPLRADVVGGVMVPGRDQIPGSASDWHAIQRWVRPGGDGPACVWVTPDVPLVQFGGFNTGRWTRDLSLEKPVLYSWVLNNYWFTNFVAEQRGEFFFRYAASPRRGVTDIAAHRFAREVTAPLRGVVVDGAGGERTRPASSLVAVEPVSIDLVAVKEAEQVPGALVLRLRNRCAEAVEARVTFSADFRPRHATRTNILEEPLGEVEVEGRVLMLGIRPWRLVTLLVRF